MHFIQKYFPILSWLGSYKKEHFRSDLFSGITVGVMLIPQGMAYALIAGLPPVYGLYASIIPQIIYTILGTSRQLSVGPVAMDSLLVASGISVLATEGTELYIHFAVLLALLMGLIQFLLGVLRMGFITNLLSKPVISGFTSAAAFIIGLNQLKHLLGISFEKSNKAYSVFISVIKNIQHTHILTLIIGLAGIFIIKATKKINRKAPGSLIAVALGIVTIYFFNIDRQGVVIIKEIPQGLPAFQFPKFNIEEFLHVFPLALTIALVAFMESFSITKAFESKKRDHKVNSNQELVALGAANFIGALFQSYPVAGGFSRSAVNYESGSKTLLSSIFSAILVGLVLLFFTPLFYFLPKAILASIIMVAVVNLIDFKYTIKLFISNKIEFTILFITFIVTLNIGMVEGISSGIIASILFLLYKSTYPHIAKLGKVKGHHEFRNISRFSDLEQWKNILIIRHDGPLTFINIQQFKDFITKEISQANNNLDYIILDASPISTLDATAIDGIKDILKLLEEHEVQLLITDVIGPVRDILSQSDLINLLNKEYIFLDINEAIRFATTQNKGRFQSFAIQANLET